MSSIVVPFPKGTKPWRERLIAESPAMQELLALVERIAPTSLSVLLQGETGSGKDVIARAIHAASGRTGSFVALNCAALPETLAESELFGHVRGAFTGAMKDWPGLFRIAEGGSLFLDEVAELAPSIQSKLLRVLEEGTVRMIGGTRELPVDCRIIAATHRDLGGAVATRFFREDLYHRLLGIELTVPPLRERPQDIIPLIERFYAEMPDRGIPLRFADGAAEYLKGYEWPGNVRELRQAVRRAAVLGGAVLSPADFRLSQVRYRQEECGAMQRAADLPRGDSPAPWLEGKRWRDIEQLVLEWAVKHYGGIRPAAEALGRPRSTIADRVKRYGLTAGEDALL